jgi:N-acetylglucosaminyldiphosphoundecaprenol N-acetyl-beta-D-mannosaminyltransferase
MNSDLRYTRGGAQILDTFVDSLSIVDALEQTGDWARLRSSRYICFCNVHALVTASVRSDLAKTYDDADLVLPDGAPVAWMLRVLGYKTQKRISGPDFMWQCCARAQDYRASVFLYGNTQTTLEALERILHEAFPRLRIAGMLSPPYRPLTSAEDDAIVNRINNCGAHIVFVSLGCPKQELWMAKHRDRVQAVMLGVGAAFDFHAGTVQRPPVWVQNLGFEWLCRLAQEPKRLWKRYLLANSIFVYRAVGQAIDHALNRHGALESMRTKTPAADATEQES